MEDSKKKPIMIAIIVVCIGVAGAITYITSSGGGGGIETVDRGEIMWVKCSNPDCGAEYETDKRDYLEYIQEHQKGMSTPPLICKECGEESVYRAVKCEKCGAVFFYGAVRDAKFKDTCPECGYSKTEQIRKEARQRK